MSNRYVFKLTADDLKKAVTELNEPENNDERLERIDQLRTAFFRKNKDLALVRNDDSFILRFLRAKQFKLSEALKVLTNYCSWFSEWNEVSEKVENFASVKHLFDFGCFVGLNVSAKDKSLLCVLTLGKVENATFSDFIALSILSLNQMLEEERGQIYGISAICDFRYVSCKFLATVRPFVAKKYVRFLVECMPIRVKAIHVVNPSLLSRLTILPMYKLYFKLYNNKFLHVHGKNSSKLQEYIDQSVLPREYGGTSSSIDKDSITRWRDEVFGSIVAWRYRQLVAQDNSKQ